MPLFSHPSALLALNPRVAPQFRSSCSVSQCGCRSPRTPHLRVIPAFDLQVALNLESIRRFQRFSSFGFPRNSISPVAPLDALRVSPFLHLPVLPAIDHRVAPNLVSFSASGASASGFPAASLFQLRLPIQAPGCPGSCIFRLCRQRIFELPRISRSSVPPVLELSVSLELRSSRLRLPMLLMGFPSSFTFRLGLGFDLPGCPGFSLPRRRLMDPRVSSVLASSGSAVPASSGFPESCIYGWVDDVSRSSRTLHPQLSPRMNLRIRSSYAVSLPRLWMRSFNLIHAFHLPVARLMNCRLQLHPASSCQVRNCISNSLLAHQLKRSLGLLNLWKQVQKKSNSVDITSVGA